VKRRTLFALIIIFFAALSGCEKAPRPPEGTAPEFVLKDTGGKSVRLSDYRGKVVLLEFWATWCPPCKLAIPDLNELHERYKGKDFALLSISVDDSLDTLKPFVEEYGIKFPVLVNDAEVERLYGIINIPATLIIDKEGNIAGKHLGYVPGTKEMLTKEIEELL
jgi:peroxiredoxin